MAKDDEQPDPDAIRGVRLDADDTSASEALRKRREKIERTLRLLNGKRTVILLETDAGTTVRIQGALRYDRLPTDGITEDGTGEVYLFSDYAIVRFA